jgi:asparagine synthase (glutamine-hydrolysing)
MCGIYLSNKVLSANEIISKLKGMKHRGPDNQSYWVNDQVTLGHVRLSILDTDQRGNQPMHYQNMSITYNGEIYNYLEIKDDLITNGYDFETNTDTEVILKAFHFWGRDFINKLNGMFAFAIYDKSKNKTYCYRDRIGVKPFYYFFDKETFELSSQLSVLSHPKKISSEGLEAYLLTGYIPSPLSIFENVKKLQPGSELIYDNEKHSLSISCFWDLKERVPQQRKSFDQNIKQLKALLIDAVKIRLASDVPLGAFLSGGIDSSLICSLLVNELNVKNLKTFTLGFQESGYDESPKAFEYAKHLDTNHHSIKIDVQDLLNTLPDFIKAYDEPFSDSSAIPSLILSKKIKKHITVVLSGDGGDESFLGYDHFINYSLVSKILWIPYSLRKFIVPLIPFHLLSKKPEILKKIFGLKNPEDFIVETFLGGVDYLHNHSAVFLKYYFKYLKLSKRGLQKMADYNIKLWLENDSNVKVDRASMAHSLEVRSPFLDYRVIEFARSLPVTHRLRLFNRKAILKKILAFYIPAKLFKAPKKGFAIPLNDWIKNDLKGDITKELNDKFLQSIPNLECNKFKKSLLAHFKGEKDFSRHIWRLYVLAKWAHFNKIKFSK